MPLYLVRYAVTHLGHYGPEIVREDDHHALLMEAPTRVDAFATAYDHLSRKHLAVSTKLTDKYKHLSGKTLDYCDMSGSDLEELKARGIPVDKFEGSTTILSITEHAPQIRGRIVSAEDQHSEERGASNEAQSQ